MIIASTASTRGSGHHRRRRAGSGSGGSQPNGLTRTIGLVVFTFAGCLVVVAACLGGVTYLALAAPTTARGPAQPATLGPEPAFVPAPEAVVTTAPTFSRASGLAVRQPAVPL